MESTIETKIIFFCPIYFFTINNQMRERKEWVNWLPRRRKPPCCHVAAHWLTPPLVACALLQQSLPLKHQDEVSSRRAFINKKRPKKKWAIADVVVRQLSLHLSICVSFSFLNLMWHHNWSPSRAPQHQTKYFFLQEHHLEWCQCLKHSTKQWPSVQLYHRQEQLDEKKPCGCLARKQRG